MYKNLLSDLNVVNQGQIFGGEGFHFQDPQNLRSEEFIKRLYDRLDKMRCPMDQETFAYTAEISLLLAMKGIALYYKEEADQELILKTASRELQILERGACTGTEQDCSQR